MTDAADISVLQLATVEEIFFRQQVDVLERKGVDCTTVVVPGGEQIDGAMADRRGVAEYLQYVPRVRRALADGSYDLLHANYGLTAPYAITQFSLPVVLTLWGSDVVGWEGAVTKLCAPRCDAITVRSEEMRRLLGRDAHIVPSGVDMGRFEPMPRNEARRELGWDGGKNHVLFPYAPDYERKNYPLGRRVVGTVRDRIDDEIELRTMSDVAHELVPVYMNASDVLLLTSRYEGSPNTVKEAMACDLPVVSTEVGDVKERLDGVRQSFVGTSDAELVEALVDVLHSGERSDGREAVREVSWDRIGDRIIDIYGDVVAS